MNGKQLLLNAYDGMTPWAQGIILELAQGYAIDFPEPKTNSPGLGIEPPANDADEPVDGLPLISIGKPIHG